MVNSSRRKKLIMGAVSCVVEAHTNHNKVVQHVATTKKKKVQAEPLFKARRHTIRVKLPLGMCSWQGWRIRIPTLYWNYNYINHWFQQHSSTINWSFWLIIFGIFVVSCLWKMTSRLPNCYFWHSITIFAVVLTTTKQHNPRSIITNNNQGQYNVRCTDAAARNCQNYWAIEPDTSFDIIYKMQSSAGVLVTTILGDSSPSCTTPAAATGLLVNWLFE